MDQPVDPMDRNALPRCCRVASRVLSLTLLGGIGFACVASEDPGPVVVLPPEAYRYERFIEAPTRLTADRVLVEAVLAYRKDVAPVINEDYHTKEITPDRIRLVNLDTRFTQNPVSLAFRNMQIRARQSIEVRFSNVPLLTEQEEPPVILVEAFGVVSLKGAGADVIAEKVVIRNHEVKAFLGDGREIPAEGRRR